MKEKTSFLNIFDITQLKMHFIWNKFKYFYV
jgi:hypothetical protein